MKNALFQFDQRKKTEEYRNSGWKIIGHFCSYTPEEIFYHRKMLPVRIFPEFCGNYDRADQYYPAYTCSFGRSALNALLTGKYEQYDGLFFSSTCDTIRCLLHHSQRTHPDKFIPFITMPAKAFAASSNRLLLNELKRLDEAAGRFSGRRNGEILDDMVELYRTNRALIKEVIQLRMKRPGLIPAKTMNQIYHYNMWVDKPTANETLRQFLKTGSSGKTAETGKPTVVVLGNCCGNNSILEFIEDAGCHVVNDLLASGHKFFDDVERRPTPLETIAARLNDKIHCPTKMITFTNEREHLLEQILRTIRDSHADGVIVLSQKFCDPHGLDKPLTLGRLKKELPVLELESEQDINNPGQLRTRIEAFLEVI